MIRRVNMYISPSQWVQDCRLPGSAAVTWLVSDACNVATWQCTAMEPAWAPGTPEGSAAAGQSSDSASQQCVQLVTGWQVLEASGVAYMQVTLHLHS